MSVFVCTVRHTSILLYLPIEAGLSVAVFILGTVKLLSKTFLMGEQDTPSTFCAPTINFDESSPYRDTEALDIRSAKQCVISDIKCSSKFLRWTKTSSASSQ